MCVLALGTGLYRWWARRHNKAIVARLHALRRELRQARKRERADRARRRGTQRRGRTALLGAQCVRWGVAVRKASLHAVHESVVAARHKLFDLGGESTRIILNASKCYSHLPVTNLQSTFLAWPPCLSQRWPGFFIPAYCFAIP